MTLLFKGISRDIKSKTSGEIPERTTRAVSDETPRAIPDSVPAAKKAPVGTSGGISARISKHVCTICKHDKC